MPASFKTTTIVAAVLVATASTVSAQQPTAAAPAGPQIVLIDVGYIFKNHAGFKQKMDQMKQEIKSFESQINGERTAILKQRDKLSSYKSGSVEYKRLEQQIAQQAADLQVRADLKRKELLEREASLYYATYQEVSQAVTAFANQNGISLVLRFDREKTDPSSRNDVLKGVNRAVVYQRNLDITMPILRYLNGNSTARNNASPGARTR